MNKQEGWELFYSIRDKLREQAASHALLLWAMSFFFVLTWILQISLVAFR